MIENAQTDPLVGKELVSVHLEAFSIHFVFFEMSVQIASPFIVKYHGIVSNISPAQHAITDAGLIWKMVGQKVLNLLWDSVAHVGLWTAGEIRIIFEDTHEILIPPTDQPRGSIIGWINGNESQDLF